MIQRTAVAMFLTFVWSLPGAAQTDALEPLRVSHASPELWAESLGFENAGEQAEKFEVHLNGMVVVGAFVGAAGGAAWYALKAADLHGDYTYPLSLGVFVVGGALVGAGAGWILSRLW